MAKSKRSRAGRRTTAERDDYFSISRRPLQILAFLLPLIVAYELGLAILLRSEHGVLTNKAHETLLQFFAAFGVTPQWGFFYLGGVAVIVVLMVWHVLNRDRWTIRADALGLMALESLALTVPLLVLGQVITHAASGSNAAGTLASSAGGAGGAQGLAGLGLASKLAISIGAGLYEELLFRMLLIAAMHTLLVDVGKASHGLGAAVAVLVSAAAFTWYHQLGNTAEMAFIFLAGVYFGAVYVVRGFGIVVAVHALYDMITLTLLGGGGQVG